MRTNHAQLPTYDELCRILAYEDKRIIPKEKESTHYADFSPLLNLLKEYNLPNSFFTQEFTFEDFANKHLFDETVELFEHLSAAILSDTNPENKILFNAIYEYLSEEDTLQHTDIIFVFGGKKTFRMEKAMKLYKQGLASNILVSGKAPFYEKDNVQETEADMLKTFAVQNGIPEDDIIAENQSITVPDNVKRSLNLLDHSNIPHQKIILINSPFSQRRGWVHFQKMSLSGTELVRINTDRVSEELSKDGWHTNEVGIKVITKEFFSLRMSELINSS
jgi:hypothetical protein